MAIVSGLSSTIERPAPPEQVIEDKARLDTTFFDYEQSSTPAILSDIYLRAAFSRAFVLLPTVPVIPVQNFTIDPWAFFGMKDYE